MKSLFSILGLLGMPVGLYVLSLVIRGGGTPWAWAWMVAYILVDLGLFWLATETRRAQILLALGLTLTGIIVGLRHVKSHPTALGRTMRVASHTDGRWLGRIGEEADLGMMLYVALGDVGGYRSSDVRLSKAAVRQAYKRMRNDPDYAPVPSPLLPSMLGMGNQGDAEMIEFNMPPEGNAPRAIIYLHGVGGAQKLPCWMLARRMPDALVLCPSAGLRGQWDHSDGEAVFQQAVTWAREHAQAVYVIGFGTGGHAALHFLNRNLMGHLSGAALISGFDENYFDDVRRSGIPILILHGALDQRTPAFRVEGLAGLDRVRNVEVDNAGYFLLYEREDEMLEELDTFCGAH